MSKSFKRQRRYEEYDDEGYHDNRKNKDFKNRRREKQMRNDLKSMRNVSTSDLHFHDEE